MRCLLVVLGLVVFQQNLLAAPPENDRFAKAIVLSAGATDVLVDNAEATAERGEPGLQAFSARQTVWYSFTAPSDGTLVIGEGLPLGNTSFPLVNVYTGTSLPKLKRVSTEFLPFNAFFFQSFEALRLRAGQKCYLQVDSSKTENSRALFRLSLLFSNSGFLRFIDPPPQRGQRPFSYLEGVDSTIPITVGRLGGTEGTVQVNYSVEAVARLGGPLTGTLTFGPGVSRQTFTLTFANDTTKQSPTFPDITLSNATGGAAILDTKLEIDLEDDDNTPANDNFANALPLTGSGSETAPAAVATLEPGEPTGFRTVWYRYTPAADGMLLVDLPNYTTQTTRIFVDAWRGDSVDDLTFVPDVTNNFATNQSRYAVVAGEPVYLRLYNVANNYSLPPVMAYTFSPESGVIFPTGFGFVFNTATRGSVLQIPVERVGSTANEVTVSYTIRPSSDTTAGKDYKDTPGTVTFPAGERMATISIQILKRARKGDEGSFQVVLGGAPAGVFLGDSFYAGLSNGPALSSVASFAASLAPAAGESIPAFLNLQVSRTGIATGKLTFGSKAYPFSKPFPLGERQANDRTGATVVQLPDGLTLTLAAGELLAENFFAWPLSAVLKRGETVLASVDKALSYSDLFSKPPSSAYTLALQPGSGVPANLANPGSASLRINARGTATLIGTLSDGVKFSARSKIVGKADASLNPQSKPVFPFGVALYGGKGALHGEVALASLNSNTAPAAGDGGGAFRWTRPADPEPTAAFTGTLSAMVSQYLLPAGHVVLGGLPPNPLQLTVTDGATPQVFPFTLRQRNAVTFDAGLTNPPRNLTFTAATGLFSGTLADGTQFSGAILRNLGAGRGSAQFGVGTANFRSGLVTITTPP